MGGVRVINKESFITRYSVYHWAKFAHLSVSSCKQQQQQEEEHHQQQQEGGRRGGKKSELKVVVVFAFVS